MQITIDPEFQAFTSLLTDDERDQIKDGLSPEARKLLIGKIYNRKILCEKEERRKRRRAIQTARAEFARHIGAREPCAVCGKHNALTHAHHVWPLAEQVHCGVRDVSHEHVWLCPNHHEAVHAVYSITKRGGHFSETYNVLADFSEAERMKILDIQVLACKGGVA